MGHYFLLLLESSKMKPNLTPLRYPTSDSETRIRHRELPGHPADEQSHSPKDSGRHPCDAVVTVVGGDVVVESGSSVGSGGGSVGSVVGSGSGVGSGSHE